MEDNKHLSIILALGFAILSAGLFIQAFNDRIALEQSIASREEVKAELADTLDACRGSDQIDCHIEYWYDEQGYATGGEVISRDPEE